MIFFLNRRIIFNRFCRSKHHPVLSQKMEESERKIKIFGLWIYLMSDLVFFSCLFLVYTVFVFSKEKEIFFFDSSLFFLNSFFSLLTNFFCSSSYFFCKERKMKKVIILLFFSLFFSFLSLLISYYEMYSLFYQSGFYRSSLFSSVFSILFSHFIHLIVSVFFTITTIVYLYNKGYIEENETRIFCLNLFLGFLCIVWILIISFFYLGNIFK